MVRSAVKVVLRTRPTDNFATECIRLQEDGKTVVLHLPKRSKGDLVNHTQENFTFKLDRLLHNVTQEQVFENCGVEIVSQALEGYNGSILCYGQTGGGKTYTMMGGGDYKTRGIVPRMVKNLYDEIGTRVDKMFEISISFMEIYNEHIRDLLDTTNQEDMLIQEDVKGNISVRGLTKRPCATEAEALQYLFEGTQNRAVAEHALNSNSSRSHCVYTMHISSRTRIESGAAAVTSKIHCIDLAGSERLSKSGSEGQLMKEAQYINKSLSYLEHVVISLGSQSRSHVPFRQSKLTNLLKDSLGGNCQTTMIVNVWPEERHLDETLSTMKFATRMMKVQNEASINVVLDASTQIKQLQKLVTELKAELQMQNQLHGKSHVAYEGDLGEDERFEMEKVVKQYFGNQIPEVPINSIREVKEYFKIMKAYVANVEAEAGVRGPAQTGGGGGPVPSGPTKGAAPPAHRQSVSGAAGGQNGGNMGDLDGQGHGVGVAAAARNIREIVATSYQAPQAAHASPQRAMGGGGLKGAAPHHSASNNNDSGAMDDGLSSLGGGARAMLPDRTKAYEDFKVNDGAELNRLLRESQSQLAERRKLITEVSREVNLSKSKIDTTKEKLDHAQTQRMTSVQGRDMVDESEHILLRDLQQFKNEYKQHYDQLCQLKSEKEYHTKMVEQTRAKLLQEFESWYSRFADNNGGDAETMMRNGATVDDQLDEGERFEMMEVAKIMEEDPDSLAFYCARKAVVGGGGSKPRKMGGKVAPTNPRRPR